MRLRLTLALVLLVAAARAQDDVADIKSEDRKIGRDENKRYFRMGPRKKKAPRAGRGLLIILPGGGGGAQFHTFCKRIYKHGCDDSFVAVQPVAVKWTPEQVIVWPTKKNPVKKMKFTTEEFVEAVIADAAQWQRIDPKRVYVLAWSSSGPAAYAISLTKDHSPTGFFVAMSVFKPDRLPSLKGARGQAYFVYHSQGDRICPFRMAKDADKKLSKNGAKVKFREYRGAHGWSGPLYVDIRKGLDWLDKNHAKPSRKSKAKAAKPTAAGG